MMEKWKKGCEKLGLSNIFYTRVNATEIWLEHEQNFKHVNSACSSYSWLKIVELFDRRV